MDKRSFDQNVVISIACGGFVVALYGVLQTSFRFLSTNTLSFDYYRSEINITAFSGLVVMLFALFYGIINLRKKITSLEQIWEENRKSVIKFCLSIVDNDVTSMNWIFEKLELGGFDFSRESDEITFGDIKTINYNSIKEQFNKLPLLQNALGFITYEQYMAIYNYLKYGTMFVDLLDKHKYQKDLLELRSEEAKKILEFFSNEENNHYGLKEWKRYFSSI